MDKSTKRDSSKHYERKSLATKKMEIETFEVKKNKNCLKWAQAEFLDLSSPTNIQAKDGQGGKNTHTVSIDIHQDLDKTPSSSQNMRCFEDTTFRGIFNRKETLKDKYAPRKIKK